MLWTSLALIFGLPLAVLAATGFPIGFVKPELRGFNFVGGIRLLPEFVALLLALTTYTAAFIAEIVRAGILAVPRGQTEAALALGLRRGPTLRLVVVPQALRVIVPPLTNQYLNLTKNSSLAVAIGYPDLFAVFAGTTLNQTGQAIEIIAITMAVYLAISLLTSATDELVQRPCRGWRSADDRRVRSRPIVRRALVEPEPPPLAGGDAVDVDARAAVRRRVQYRADGRQRGHHCRCWCGRP